MIKIYKGMINGLVFNCSVLIAHRCLSLRSSIECAVSSVNDVAILILTVKLLA